MCVWELHDEAEYFETHVKYVRIVHKFMRYIEKCKKFSPGELQLSSSTTIYNYTMNYIFCTIIY